MAETEGGSWLQLQHQPALCTPLPAASWSQAAGGELGQVGWAEVGGGRGGVGMSQLFCSFCQPVCFL